MQYYFNHSSKFIMAIRSELFKLGVPEHLKGYEYLIGKSVQDSLIMCNKRRKEIIRR